MPRRLSYTPDDEDDDLRRRGSASGGGGIPGWVWVLGGGGVLAVVLVVGLGFALFTARRAEVRHEVARAEAMRVEADQAAKVVRFGEGTRRVPGPAEEAEEVSLAVIAKAHRDDAAAAEGEYAGRRLRVLVGVRQVGGDWVGAVASIGRLPRDRSSNVYFHFDRPDDRPAVGELVEIEGTCAGFTPDPHTGVRLTFTNCRVVDEE